VSKMLHGGRLGNIRSDVAKFCSSRKDDARLADAVLAINKAHVSMLIEQKIIQPQDGGKILAALQKQNSQNLDLNAEDVHMAIEEAVLALTGPEVGGNLHIAKSRNDQTATAIRIALRSQLLIVMGQIVGMQQELLKTAAKHTETIILEYTHLQAAQPVTFAHYLLFHVDALGRDLQRLISAYERVNLCPLGAGGLATTSFPINRKRTAELLGFNAVLENSLDAVGSRDFIVETQAALALLAINLSRFAEDLIVWSSAEFGTIELPDEFASTSSIMPQKKNPEVLEVIRARASYVLGDFLAAAGIIKSLPTTYNLDLQEVTPKLWASIDNLEASLRIFTVLVPCIKVNTAKVEEKAAKGFVAATEVANMLVSNYGVAFRTSHKIVGALVKALIEENKTLSEVTPDLLAKVAEDSAAVKLAVKSEDIVSCTNLHKIVETYKVQGGPSRAEVNRSIKAHDKIQTDNTKAIIELNAKLADAADMLSKVVTQYSGKKVKNHKT
jgi:argininosuccinate lyase